MDYKYASSAKVKVYPSAWRGEGINPESTLNTEENLTNLVKGISSQSNQSYVVSYDSNSDKMTFRIAGYLFELSDASTLRMQGSPLWASIKLFNDAPTGNSGFANLTLADAETGTVNVLDVDNEGSAMFRGVAFTANRPQASPNSYMLQLMNDRGEIPPESWLNISTTQIQDGKGSTSPIASEFHTGALSATHIYASDLSTSDISTTSISTWKVNAKSQNLSFRASTIDLYASGSSGITLHGNIYGTDLTLGGSLNASSIYASGNTYLTSLVVSGAAFLDSGAHISRGMRVYGGAVFDSTVEASTVKASTLNTTHLALGSNYIDTTISNMNMGVRCHGALSIYAAGTIELSTSGGYNVMASSNIGLYGIGTVTLAYGPSATDGLYLHQFSKSGGVLLQTLSSGPTPKLMLPSFSGYILAAASKVGDSYLPVYVKDDGTLGPVSTMKTVDFASYDISNFFYIRATIDDLFSPVSTDNVTGYCDFIMREKYLEMFLSIHNIESYDSHGQTTGLGMKTNGGAMRLYLRNLLYTMRNNYPVATQALSALPSSYSDRLDIEDHAWVQITPQILGECNGWQGSTPVVTDQITGVGPLGITSKSREYTDIGNVEVMANTDAWEYTLPGTPGGPRGTDASVSGALFHIIIPFK